MQETEVAAWRWVPLAYLSPEEVRFEVPLQVSGHLASSLVPFPCLPSLTLVHMPCIDLKPLDVTATSNPEVPFRLWGLTLRATSDALVLATGKSRELPWPPLRFRFRAANLLLAAWCSTQELRRPREHRFRCSHLLALLIVVGFFGAILTVALKLTEARPALGRSAYSSPTARGAFSAAAASSLRAPRRQMGQTLLTGNVRYAKNHWGFFVGAGNWVVIASFRRRSYNLEFLEARDDICPLDFWRRLGEFVADGHLILGKRSGATSL